MLSTELQHSNKCYVCRKTKLTYEKMTMTLRTLLKTHKYCVERSDSSVTENLFVSTIFTSVECVAASNRLLKTWLEP